MGYAWNADINPLRAMMMLLAELFPFTCVTSYLYCILLELQYFVHPHVQATNIFNLMFLVC